MNTVIKVYDEYIKDRNGIGTWVWTIYQDNVVVSVEFSRGMSGLTARVEFPAPKGVLPRPWLRSIGL